MKIGSLFAGIGGFDLAARWMGWETAWFSEIDPYASAVLAKHWPGVPNHGDITRIDFSAVEPVDMLCGGFPCQDISNAGKRKGITGERSGLWSEYARAIGELRPRYVVVENVAALLGRGLERVLGDLAESGYDAEWSVLSAADVGAPHLRERVWIVAYPRHTEPPRWIEAAARARQGQPPQGEPAPYGASPGDVALAARQLLDGSGNPGAGRRSEDSDRRQDVADADEGGQSRRGEHDARRGESGWPQREGWWRAEPDVGRVAHGVPARVDRLRCLGNAIVPRCALVIFQAIEAQEVSRV